MIPIALPPNRPGIIEFSQPTGQSDEAVRLRKIVEEIRGQQSVRACFADLEAACLEAGVGDWDGHRAKALEEGSKRNAQYLLGALLLIAPGPEVTVDADGEVEFDWLTSSDRALTLSISGEGRLTYAWRDGARRGHGTEWFSGSIPATLAAAIAEVTRDGRSA